MIPPARPHGISPEPFPVYSPDLRIKVTVAFWDYDALSHLIRLIRLTIRFLSVEPRFRYCFLSPTPHDVNLASRYRVRRQLRPLGLPPKLRDMPVIQEPTAGGFPAVVLFSCSVRTVQHGHPFLFGSGRGDFGPWFPISVLFSYCPLYDNTFKWFPADRTGPVPDRLVFG